MEKKNFFRETFKIIEFFHSFSLEKLRNRKNLLRNWFQPVTQQKWVKKFFLFKKKL